MPVRILHVVGSMDRGGVETWLTHVLRKIDRTQYQMDFLVHSGKPGAYDDEIRDLGSKIIVCAYTCNPVRYASAFLGILAGFGPYAAVHCHVHWYSGLVMKLAANAEVPSRITHSHNDTSLVDRQANLSRSLYLKTANRWISRHATTLLAASAPAAEALYGPRWKEDPRVAVTLYGLDLDAYLAPTDRNQVRAEFGIGPQDLVFGHVGRFHSQKNHSFLLRVAQALMSRHPSARLLLIGEGELRDETERLAHDLGIAARTIFAGGRDDVSRIMLGAMDVLLFPSLYEGLGLVAVEAQAAGLPVVVSGALPAAATWRPGLVTPIAGFDVAEWTVAVEGALKSPRLEPSAGGPFGIRNSVEALMKVYSSCGNA